MTEEEILALLINAHPSDREWLFESAEKLLAIIRSKSENKTTDE